MIGTTPPLPLEEAQARLFALVSTPTSRMIPIEDALGYFTLEPLVARRTQPAAAMSAMDGYAVREDDLTGPWTVIGESAAGHPFDGAVNIGQAVRIATGALVPSDTNCVILQEDLARAGETINLTGELPVPASKHIRPKGMDFKEGAEILPVGSKIGPAQIALAISSGNPHVSVACEPRVAVIDSGDELSALPGENADHRIPASNGAMLLAMVRSLPSEARRFGPVADTMEDLADIFAATAEYDVVVTSGGASVGDHDLIRPALEALGAKVDFWRVAIKPGKPLLVATLEREGRKQIFIGLPGNPVSSHVTAYLFLLPLLRALLGAANPSPQLLDANLGAPLKANSGRREFVRGYWDGHTVVPQTIQDSGALAPLAASNVLIDRPNGAHAISAGERVRVYLL